MMGSKPNPKNSKGGFSSVFFVVLIVIFASQTSAKHPTTVHPRASSVLPEFPPAHIVSMRDWKRSNVTKRLEVCEEFVAKRRDLAGETFNKQLNAEASYGLMACVDASAMGRTSDTMTFAEIAAACPITMDMDKHK